MITGGTGSFGNAMLQRLLKMDPARVVVFSRDEKKQHDMRYLYQDNRLQFQLGDVRDVEGLGRALAGVDYVFHAAALKQVPSCEFFPLEAIKTNSMGANNLLSLLKRSKVKSCVFLSTDKAVYPINVMGLSKALMEKIVIASARENEIDVNGANTRVNITRYGNVMGSRGSVIPLFVEAAKKNLDINVTDARMTRFMMSLSQSVDLVLGAWQHERSGEIFVYRANAARIIDVAQAIINLTGSRSKISVVGSRHGEKLHETLISSEEIPRSTTIDELSIISYDGRGLNYSEYFEGDSAKSLSLDAFDSSNAKMLSIEDCERLLVETFGADLNV
jgi:UDP-N-acetylglucosamine 4,6-dehydratase/5-epimerase